MLTGECNCGVVAFEVTETVTDIFVCHCSICRRSTGSSGIEVVLVNRSAFRWVRGEEIVATWRKPGADWQTWFCRTCASPMPGTNDEAQVFIPVGSIIKGAEGLRVAHHLFVGSKAPWHVIGDDGKQHPDSFRA